MEEVSILLMFIVLSRAQSSQIKITILINLTEILQIIRMVVVAMPRKNLRSHQGIFINPFRKISIMNIIITAKHMLFNHPLNMNLKAISNKIKQ